MGRLKRLLVILGLLICSPAMAQQPSKVTDMPFAGLPLSGSELLNVIQSGISKKTTVGNLLSSLGPTAIVPVGCVGDDAADDTACIQSAIDLSEGLKVPLFFDGIHLYKITSTLYCKDTCSLQGVAPTGNDGVNGDQNCIWGLDASGMNKNLLVVSGESAHIENMCLQMEQLGSDSTAGAAIVLGGTDQQSDDIEGNTIFRPYDGIAFGQVGFSPNQVRDSLASNNIIRDCSHICLSVGAGTTFGATVGITLDNNRIACTPSGSGGVGFAFFDGAVFWNGTTVGPNNCYINTEIVPGANQDVNGQFYGVVGDSAGTHGGGANPKELYIEPSSSSGVVNWLQFTGVWAASVVAADTNVYIGNKNSGLCSNITFSNLNAPSGIPGGQTQTNIIDIEGCQNITITGGMIDSWQGTATNGILLNNGVDNQPVHISITGNHIGTLQAGSLTNGINVSLGSNKLNPEYLAITGNELSEASSPLTITSQAAITGQLWAISNNEGVDDVCPTITSATTMQLPGAFSCYHVGGSTTVTAIYPAWANRKVTLVSDIGGGLVLNTGGANVPLCSNLTVPVSNAAYLEFNTGGVCWMHQ